MNLTVTQGFSCAPCEISVNVAGTGGQIELAGQSVAMPSDGAWHTLTVTLPSAPSSLVANGHYIQMIELARAVAAPTATATATATPSRAPTAEPSPTVTVTVIYTVTPTPDVLPRLRAMRDELDALIADLTPR
jgi:hypothetical protein